MTTETAHRLTDRERLLLSLDELNTRHGYQSSNPADLHCCGTCLADWMDGLRPLVVGWHIQCDEAAFRHGYPAIDWGDGQRQTDMPICARCTELQQLAQKIETTDGCPDCEEGAWRAAEYDHIISDHHRLVGTLALLVRGERHLVVAVLRRHGLRAQLSEYDGWVNVTSAVVQP